MTNDNYWRDRMIKLEKRIRELEKQVKTLEDLIKEVKNTADAAFRTHF